MSNMMLKVNNNFKNTITYVKANNVWKKGTLNYINKDGVWKKYIPPVPAYGVAFKGSTVKGIRTGLAVGATVEVAHSLTETVKNDFDNFPIYKDFIKKVVKDTEMIGIPKFYCKVSLSPNGEDDSFSITDQPAEGYFLHPAFKIYSQGIYTGRERDYVYISKYNITSAETDGPRADKNIKPLYGFSAGSLDYMRKYVKPKGNYWHLSNWMTWGVCQILFTIEHATRDSNSIMLGNSTGKIQLTGLTDGAVASNLQLDNRAMNWRGIENLYNNVSEWLDGIYSASNTPGSNPVLTKNYRITYDWDKWITLSYSGINIPGKTGKVLKALGYDENHPGAYFPIRAIEGNNTYYCGTARIIDRPAEPWPGYNSYPAPSVGGSTFEGNESYPPNIRRGIFSWDFLHESDTSPSFALGFRLAFMPE